MDWLRVPLERLGSEGRAVVAADGAELVLIRAGDAVHAFANECPHEGNPLSEGEVVGDTLTCVFHGWRFDLSTGACLVGDEAARRYPAEVRDGEVWIRLA